MGDESDTIITAHNILPVIDEYYDRRIIDV